MLLLKGALAATQRSILRLGGRLGQGTPRAQGVESTQLSEPEVVHCGAGFKNSRNATGSSGAGQVTGCASPSGELPLSETLCFLG